MPDLLAKIHPVLPAQNDTVWVASVDEAGSVHLSTRVVLGSEENRLFLCSPAKSGLVANVSSRPNVAFSAANPSQGAGSQVKGRATIHQAGPVWERWVSKATQLGFPNSNVIIEVKAFLEFAVQPTEGLLNPRSQEAK